MIVGSFFFNTSIYIIHIFYCMSSLFFVIVYFVSLFKHIASPAAEKQISPETVATPVRPGRQEKTQKKRRG